MSEPQHICFAIATLTDDPGVKQLLKLFEMLDFNLDFLETRPTAGSAATAGLTSETKTVTANTAKKKEAPTASPPPPTHLPPTNPSTFQAFLEDMANVAGGIISYDALGKAAKAHKEADDCPTQALAEVESEFEPDSTSAQLQATIGYKMITCIINVADAEYFQGSWTNLLATPETVRHPHTWIKAARLALAATNGELQAAMSKVLPDIDATSFSSEDNISSWLALQETCQAALRKTPMLRILRRHVTTFVSTKPSTSQAQADNARTKLRKAGDACRKLLKTRPDLSALDFISILEGMSTAETSYEHGLGDFLKDHTFSDVYDSFSAANFLLSAKTFSDNHLHRLPTTSSPTKTRPGRQKQTAKQQPKSDFVKSSAPKSFSKQQAAYLTEMYSATNQTYTLESIIAAHAAAAAKHDPANVHKDLHSFYKDMANFKRFFPLKHQAAVSGLLNASA